MNIKTNPVGSLSIDQLILAQAHLQVLADKVKENGYEVPGELRSELDTVSNELFTRTKADKEKQLKVLQARRLSLSTLEEKRARADEEIKRLEKELGMVTP